MICKINSNEIVKLENMSSIIIIKRLETNRVFFKSKEYDIFLFEGSLPQCEKVVSFFWQQIKINVKNVDLQRFVRKMKKKESIDNG